MIDMGKRIRITEDEADKWLREHDPYYTYQSAHKSKKLQRSYDTGSMERTKQRVEIPFSNLNKSQKLSIQESLGTFDDKGNFEL